MASEVTDVPTDFLWKVHNYTNEYIRFADTKAAFLITAGSALVGVLVSSDVLDKSLKPAAHWGFSTWLGLLGLFSLVVSILCAAWAIKPRLWGSAAVGLIFWESVRRHETNEAYYAALQRQSGEYSKTVADHVYALGAVAKRKYLYVNLAIVFAIPGGLLAGTSVLLHHVL